jgi:hypothetical protein
MPDTSLFDPGLLRVQEGGTLGYLELQLEHFR